MSSTNQITKLTESQRKHLLAVENLLYGFSELLKRSWSSKTLTEEEADVALCYSAVVERIRREFHEGITLEGLYPEGDEHGE